MRSSIAVVLFLFLPASVSAITIDTVAIGDVGNPNDPNDGDSGTAGVQSFGSVGYAFNIGKYQVTVGQYTAFLNAVAKTDTYSLFDTGMTTDVNVAGIARSGVSGNYSYSAIGSPNHPITYVDWGDAARFANWLNNGQPAGAQIAATTEDGAYRLDGATTQTPLMAIARNSNATWVIPTEDEWYKAAYYQPAAQGGDSDNYWSYATKSNSIPFSDQPPGATPDNTQVGNFYYDDRSANGYNDGYAVTGTTTLDGSQNYLTDVGAYASSPAYYGTFDQGGNVFEWNEGKYSSTRRVLRGMAWINQVPSNLLSSTRNGELPSIESRTVGFRVVQIANVPEPSTVALTASIVALLMTRRRHD